MYIIRLPTYLYNSKTFLFKIKFAIKPEIILSFLAFDLCRFCVVIRGHS